MNRGAFGLTQTPRSSGAHIFHYRRERPDVSVTPSYVRGLYLNDRDRAVLRFLSEIGYATSGQLKQLFWRDRSGQAARARLLELWEQWVLDRQPFYRFVDYGGAAQLVYMLGRAGVKMLQDLDANVTQREGTLLMPHNVLLGQAIVQLVEKARELGAECEVTFYGEAAASATFKWDGQWARMRPDGLVYLRAEGREFPFYVEFDRNTSPIGQMTGKVKQYSLYYRSKEWKRNHAGFPGILVIVWSKYELRDGMSEAEAADRRKARAQRRLEAITRRLQGDTRTSRLRWFCQRLDLVGKEPWRVVTTDGLKWAPAFFTRGGHGS